MTPDVTPLPRMRRHDLDIKSVPLMPGALGSIGALVILFDHDVFYHGFIARHAKLIIDARGAFPMAPNVVRA